MAKKKTRKRQTLEIKICNRCGHENERNADMCEQCNSKKFAPSWVIAKRPVNRQVGVEITNTNPSYGKVEKRVTLSKWWPGGGATFHIPNISQWTTIETIINEELGPIIGWKTKRQLIESIRGREKTERKIAKDIKKLVKEYPEFLKQVVISVDPTKLGKEDMDKLMNVLGQLTDAISSADAGFRQAFLAVVKKLPKQKKRALEELEQLLESWSLHQITSVAQQVKNRLETIELFKKQVLDDQRQSFLPSGDS